MNKIRFTDLGIEIVECRRIRTKVFTNSLYSTMNTVDDDVNFWLSSNQDDVRVIDIKYAISDRYASVCVVYEDIRNYEED